MSLPEVLLWRCLKGSQTGFAFRRQYPIDQFTLDFYCPKVKLCVEVDGKAHYVRSELDAVRDAYLLSKGIETVRFPASEVLRNPLAVAEKIRVICELRLEG